MCIRDSAGARGGGLIPTMQAFAGFDEAEGFRRVDTGGFEHFGGENFAHAAFQGEASIAAA